MRKPRPVEVMSIQDSRCNHLYCTSCEWCPTEFIDTYDARPYMEVFKVNMVHQY